MKNSKKRVLAAVLALMTLLSLIACSRQDLVLDGTELKDKRTNVKYICASLSYEPIAKSDEVYGENDQYTFYSIIGQDPLYLICSDDGSVFAAEDFVIPTPDKMNFEYLEICTETDTLTVNKTVTDKTVINAIMAEHLVFEPYRYAGDVAAVTHKLRFADSSLGIFYSMTYLHYDEDLTLTNANGEYVNAGKDFIYDRFEGRLTKAPAELLAIING